MPVGDAGLQIALLGTMAVALGYIFTLGEPKQWYNILSSRLIYGIPWGTLVSIIGVVAFYLFAQSGLQHWDSPVTLPFRSWSYLYPEGLFAAGFAHASANHLISNMVGTIVLAPIVEYAWSHYPPKRTKESLPYEYPPPGDVSVETTEVQSAQTGWLGRPWIRALVIFPAVVIVVSILTSFLAVGWSLGFSGTVFAFGGFAVVYFPVTAIIAMVGITGTSAVFTALRDPILRATADPGSPGPPGWWGVNVQAHMLGFLIGVMLAIVLLRYRNESRAPIRVFFAALAFGLARQLWAFATSGGTDVYLQHRGVGIVFVFALAMIIAAIVAASDEPVPTVLEFSWAPDRRQLAYLWLGAVGFMAGLLWIPLGLASAGWFDIALFFLVVVVLVIPSLPVALPDQVVSTPITQKQVLLFGLIAITLIIATPSFTTNAPGMADDSVPGDDIVTVADYSVTYAEDAPHGRISGNESGVIVVSEQRDIWSSVVSKNRLAHDGDTTVTLGGFGWRDTVDVERTGWDVAGGDDVYVVDLEHEGETVRAFESEPSETRSQVANQTISVIPEQDEFRLGVTRNNESVGNVSIPEAGETATVGDLVFSTEEDDDSVSVFAQQDGTRVLVATKED